MNLILIDGPIGSGKTTTVRSLLSIDEFSNIEYLSSDIYYYKYFSNLNDRDLSFKLADQYLKFKFEKLIKKKEPILIEMVLSTETKFNMIKEAVEKNGYDLTYIFIGTDNPQINIDRVKEREVLGALHIPEEKIIDRYNTCMNTLPKMLEFANEGIVLNNTLSNRELVYYQYKNQKIVSDQKIHWLKDLTP